MTERPNRMLGNAGYVVAASLASKAVGALIVVAIARYLGDDLFGTYNFAFSLAAVFAIFADFGLDALAIREVSRRPQDGESFGRLLSLRLAIAAAVFPALSAAAWLLTDDLATAGLVLVAGAAALLDTVGGIFYAFFRGVQRMDREAATQIVWRAAQAGCVGAAMLAGADLTGILLAILAASVARFAVSWALCLRLGGRPKVAAGFGPWLGAALPFAAFELALAAYIEAPTLALYWVSGSEQTGWFSAAHRAVGFALIVPLALEAAIYPILAGMDGDRAQMRKAYVTGLRFVLALTAAGAMLVFGLAGRITGLLFGGGFDSTPLMVLSVVMPLSAANALTRGYLWSSDSQRSAARNMALAAALLLALLYPLVDRYGANGAAGALVVAEGALLALNLASADVKNLMWKLWPHVAAASAGISVCYSLYVFTENGVPLWAMGAACAAVFACLLLALGGLKRRELAAIWGSFSR